MKECWVPVAAASDGNYLATPGNAYAALVSVDKRASMADVEAELKKQDLAITYAWQTGQPNRGQFYIDNWIASLPPPPDGDVWMYFELKYTGDVPRSIARHVEKCILFVCGGADVVHVFEAQQVADDYSPCGPGDPQAAQTPTAETTTAAASTVRPRTATWKPVAVGAAAVAAVAGVVWLARS
jgi:hypothetical protein